MEYVTLNNGVKMPILGYGVFQISKDECKRCVLDALSAGYRLIDTAQSYYNEAQVGEALAQTDVPRKDIFLTTKVWLSNYGYEKTKASVLRSMEKLQTDYLDLILLHQPFSDYYGSYRALEDLYKEKKVRAIGVSNFYPDRLSDLCAFNEITPQIDQVEVNPFNQQIKAQENMKKHTVQKECWAPFGDGRNNMFGNETLLKIASKYNKSVPQIILRWLTQRGIVALAKSTHIERMKANLDIFDFKLADEDMQAIKSLDTKKSLFFDHQTPEAVDLFLRFLEERKDLD